MSLSLPTASTLTAARKEYAVEAIATLCRIAAQQLDEGLTTENVAVHAIGQIWAGYVPNGGEGHAAAMRDQIAGEVAKYRSDAVDAA